MPTPVPSAQLTPRRAQQAAPGPRGDRLLGSYRAIQRKGQVQFYLESWRAYGDIVRFQIGPVIMHFIAHPDAVQHVLVQNQQNYRKDLGYEKTRILLGQGLLTNEGAPWQRQRRLMQPPFTARAVSQFGETMTAATAAMLRRWSSVADRRDGLDINDEMLGLTLSMIVRTMLSLDIEAVGAEMRGAYAEACAFINGRLAAVLDLLKRNGGKL